MIFQPLYITLEKFWKDASDQGHLDIQKIKQILLGGKERRSSGGIRWDLEIWKLSKEPSVAVQFNFGSRYCDWFE